MTFPAPFRPSRKRSGSSRYLPLVHRKRVATRQVPARKQRPKRLKTGNMVRSGNKGALEAGIVGSWRFQGMEQQKIMVVGSVRRAGIERCAIRKAGDLGYEFQQLIPTSLNSSLRNVDQNDHELLIMPLTSFVPPPSAAEHFVAVEELFVADGLKAAVVLCMDVGFTMSNSFPGEESPFEQAKKVITMFVQRQKQEAVFAENKDEIALVLFGTDVTDNPLSGGDQYQNITVHRHLMLPDFDLLEDIESKIQPEGHSGKYFKSSHSSVSTISSTVDFTGKRCVGKKFEKRHIEIFTDLSSRFSKNPKDEDGSGDRGDGPFLLGGHGPSFPLKGITEQQKEGLEIVKMVMISLEEYQRDMHESLRKLCVFKKIERHSIHWPCRLTIGSNLSIRIAAYKSILQERVKKTWTVVDAKTLKKEDIQKETVYCLNDDDETEILKEDIIQVPISGFRYGSDIVPFSKVDEEQMKYKSEGKCFSVLGFCKSSQVQRRFFMGNQVLKVFAARDDEAAAVALSSLIHALNDLDMVAIVRYAYDKRANPQVGVAFPHIKHNYECLVYVQLPFMEDLRQYMFSSLKNSKKYAPTEAQLNAVDALIDSMSLAKKDEKTNTLEDMFPTTKIPNPRFQRLFQIKRLYYPFLIDLRMMTLKRLPGVHAENLECFSTSLWDSRSMGSFPVATCFIHHMAFSKIKGGRKHSMIKRLKDYNKKVIIPDCQKILELRILENLCLLHRALHPREPLPPIQQHIWNMLNPPTEVTKKSQIPLSKIKTLFPLIEAKKKDQVTAQDVFQDNWLKKHTTPTQKAAVLSFDPSYDYTFGSGPSSHSSGSLGVLRLSTLFMSTETSSHVSLVANGIDFVVKFGAKLKHFSLKAVEIDKLLSVKWQ
ncbi:X-ray repair cross-complementing protein 5 [Saguinus oedipus]|uniref:X-ray repair cross-complementing protein 5 n=1 Tax=Saguinus oedipus TaxID=9490 RepID=A0ABQ9VGM9_SAGOE|nr:X-ray repair cross-complementing protein 5 [Saguinus oedipus]